MEMKAGLTFACMNLKKLAKIKATRGLLGEGDPLKHSILYVIRLIKEKWLLAANPRAILSTVFAVFDGLNFCRNLSGRNRPVHGAAQVAGKASNIKAFKAGSSSNFFG